MKITKYYYMNFEDGSIYSADHKLTREELYRRESDTWDSELGSVTTGADLLCLIHGLLFSCRSERGITEFINKEYPDLVIPVPLLKKQINQIKEVSWVYTCDPDEPIYCPKFNKSCENWTGSYVTELRAHCVSCPENFRSQLHKFYSQKFLDKVLN